MISMVILYLVIFALVLLTGHEKLDWKPYYSVDKKTPYGTYVLNKELDHIFSEVALSQKSLFEIDQLPQGNALLVITQALNLTDTEQERMLEWVAQGNQLMIAVDRWQDKLLDTLNVDMEYLYGTADLLSNSFLVLKSSQNKNKEYIYDKYHNFRYFKTKIDSIQPIQEHVFGSQGTEGETHPVVVSQGFGTGRVFLCSLPKLFTNYYMLKEQHAEMAAEVLSLLKPNAIAYDQYYIPNRRTGTISSVFFSKPGYFWASCLGLGALFFYLLTKIPRVQRVIPIVKPPCNANLEFTKTLGDLYFNTGDKMDLQTKMYRYFTEYLSTNLQIKHFSNSAEDMERLRLKTGHSASFLNTLIQQFEQARSKELDDAALIRLRQTLQTFYYGRK